MALTNLSGQTALHAVQYDNDLWYEKAADKFFPKFIKAMNFTPTEFSNEIAVNGGVETSREGVVVQKTQLQHAPGNTIHFTRMNALTGTGLDTTGNGGNNELTGNEETVTMLADSVSLKEITHGIRDNNPYGRQSVMTNLNGPNAVPPGYRETLYEWAYNKVDDDCFAALTDSATNIMFANKKTQANILATDKLDMKVLSTARVKAIAGDFGHRIEPVPFRGQKLLFLVTSSDIIQDFKESDYGERSVEALKRGGYFDHPMFAGAQAITHDGIVLYESEKTYLTPTANNSGGWGSGGVVRGGEAILFGKRALVTAQIGGSPELYTENGLDYARHKGYRVTMWFGAKKPTFNIGGSPKDLGSMVIKVARTGRI